MIQPPAPLHVRTSNNSKQNTHTHAPIFPPDVCLARLLSCTPPPTHTHSFQHGLGMTLVAKSDHSTGNSKYASYVLRSGDLTFAFTAPYSRKCAAEAASSSSSAEPLPDYNQQQAMDFVCTHGMAVRAVGEF